MKMNITFSVIARCKKFDKNKTQESDIVEEKEDIELNFDIEKATRFLLRFFNNGLIIDNYKLLFSINEAGNVKAISLFKDNNVYVVLNPNQVINDVLKGYKYLITIDKVMDIMDFDFDAVQNDTTEEEF